VHARLRALCAESQTMRDGATLSRCGAASTLHVPWHGK
jgi:hypothetical protein